MKIIPLYLIIGWALGCNVPVTPRTERSQSKSAQPGQPAPTIQYTKPRWENNGVSLLLHFEIKNTSGRTLEFVHIHASFYDANDTLITSEDPYIDRYQGLGSGQRSAATVQTTPDRRIKAVRLEFTCNGTESFSEDSITATQVSKF